MAHSPHRANHPSAAAHRDTSHAPVDRALLMRRLGDNAELFAQLATLFLEDCPARLQDIREAVASGDAKRIRFAAHALKGTAGNMAATRLMDASGALECMGSEGPVDAALARIEIETAAVIEYFRQAVPGEAGPCAP